MTEILVPDFVKVLLIFLRILGVFISAPIFGSESLPKLVKVLLSAFIAYITFLSIDTTKIPVATELIPLGIFGMKEILTGLIIGFSLNMVFYGVSFAGYLIGFNMGLTMATAFNPGMETEENVIGEVINFAAFLIFLFINGHHYIISATVASFKAIPIGKFTITGPAFQLLIKYTGFVFIIAVKIASPIIVSYFLVVLAEGILARVIPQMQIFFVAQPLVTGIGYLLLISSLPVYVFFLKNLLKSYELNLYNLIKAMGT
jgi:flagellar biosynthetic protein FliR